MSIVTAGTKTVPAVTGNPLYYRGKTLTWQNGRELATVNGTTSYTYGADGIRTAKTVSGATTYALSGSTVLSQTTGNETLFFYYDVNGNLAQIGYKNGTAAEVFYFVTHNLQGDVTAIYNAADSTLVGTYSYDPWGRITAVTPSSSTSDPNGILTKNPFRYRGYYYDAETGFYYLNSRYYDPELCRFLNADMLLDGRTLLGYNLFAYCVNDPVNLADSRGEFAITATVVTVGVLLGGLALIGAVAANDPSVQTAVADMAKDIRNGAKNALAQLCGSSPASPSPGPNRDDDQNTIDKIRDAFNEKKNHIFSDKHKKEDILKLGNSQEEIMNKLVDIASKTSSQWIEGDNEIRTFANGMKVTIRINIHHGAIRGVNAYIGFSNRILGNLIYYPG